MHRETEGRNPFAAQAFLARVGDALFHGVPPWRKVWCIHRGPRSLVNDSRYQGVNRLHLSMVMLDHRFADPRFVTRKQAEEWGYSIAEGAVPTPIYFNSFSSSRNDPASGTPAVSVRTLYNAEQAEGAIPNEHRTLAFDAVSAVARLVQVSGVELRHTAEAEVPHYDVSTDTIVMPARDRFRDVCDYHAALLHELVHATGHGKREGRFEVRNERDDLAIEELRAEIATAFLGQDLGLGLSFRHLADHDRHVPAWHALLRDEPVRFLRCVHHAERIATHVASMDHALCHQVSQTAAADRQPAQRLPPVVVRAAEGIVVDNLRLIAPRTDFSEYIGPVIGQRQALVFQRINDRYVVAHRTRVPEAQRDQIWSFRYRDRRVEASQDVKQSTRSASSDEIAQLRLALDGTVSGPVWRPAFTRHNQYVGVLEHVGDDFVLQRTGRGALIVHRREALGEGAERGARVRIRYQDQVAEVGSAPRLRSQTRADDGSRGR